MKTDIELDTNTRIIRPFTSGDDWSSPMVITNLYQKLSKMYLDTDGSVGGISISKNSRAGTGSAE